jgi:hypothetical protein
MREAVARMLVAYLHHEIFLVELGKNTPRFVTAYPLRREADD